MTLYESNLFAAALAAKPGRRQARILERLLADAGNGGRLVEQATRDRTAALLYRTLQTGGMMQRLDSSSQARLHEFYYRTLFGNLRRISAIKEILRIVESEKIRLVLLQGISLIGKIYADPGLRPMDDIDFWVPPPHHSRMVEILEGLGYRNLPGYALSFQRGTVILDMKKHLFGAERIASRRRIIQQDLRTFLDRAEAFDLDGQTAWRLHPYDQVIYLTLHALKHKCAQWIWLVDLLFITQEWTSESWEGLLHRARFLGQTRPVYVLLYLLEHVTMGELQKCVHAVDWRRQLNLLEKFTLKSWQRRKILPAWSPWIFFAPDADLPGQMANMLESLYPSRAVLRQVFAGSENATTIELYAARSRQLLKTAALGLKKAVRR